MNLPKIDPSWLQAGALIIAGVITGIAAIEGQWGYAAAGLTGFFAILNIHKNDTSGGGQ